MPPTNHLTRDKPAGPLRPRAARPPPDAASTMACVCIATGPEAHVTLPVPGLSAFSRVAALAGIVTGGLATIMGAAGAHWVAARTSPAVLASFETGTSFALWHALALFSVAWLGQTTGASRWLRTAAFCWISGILLFAGSLWLRGLGWLPGAVAVAPAGGSLLILGWGLCAAHLISLRPPR